MTIQSFEGVVTEVCEETFWADIFDLTVRTNSQESAEILISAVPESDQDLIEPGAVFYWDITEVDGKQKNEIRFVRRNGLKKRIEIPVGTVPSRTCLSIEAEGTFV